MTRSQLLKNAVTELKLITSVPQLEAELLLAFCLNCRREELFLTKSSPVTPNQARKFTQLIAKRMLHIPLSQLIGKKSFWKWDFRVNDQVLTPRPETEIILEQALSSLKKLIETTPGKDLYIWDLATGSGVIGLCLAREIIDYLQQYPKLTNKVHFLLTDINPSSLQICRLNKKILGLSHNWQNQVYLEIRQSDLDSQLNLNRKFELIITNPPYLPVGAKPPEIDLEIYHEPKLALFSGTDGLDFFRKLIKILPLRLQLKGKLWAEIYPPQLATLEKLIKTHDYQITQIVKTSNNLPGFLEIGK